MEPAIDNGFGYVKIVPVRIRKKDGLILPETGGMSAARVALIQQGAYKNRYVLYRTSTEIRAVYQGSPYILIPQDSCLSLIELGEEEVAEPIIEVDIHVGQDRSWYGGEYKGH